MRANIKNNRTIDLNIGDEVDVSIESNPTVTVIGISEVRSEFAYTCKDIRQRHQLEDYSGYRKEYAIPDSISNDTWFFTTGTKNIIGHHRPSREQEQAAAWGDEEHNPPAGAAFEFI